MRRGMFAFDLNRVQHHYSVYVRGSSIQGAFWVQFDIGLGALLFHDCLARDMDGDMDVDMFL